MPIVERMFYVSASREAMVDHADRLGVDWKWFRHGLCELEVTGEIDTERPKPPIKIKRIKYGDQVLVPPMKQRLFDAAYEGVIRDERGNMTGFDARATIDAILRALTEVTDGE